MVKLKVLKQTHSEYNREIISDIKALYEGGRRLEGRYSIMNPAPTKERAEVTEKKKRIALDCYCNYFAQICNYYPGHLFSYPLEHVSNIPASSWYGIFMDNCDGLGTNYIDWERYVLTESLVGGRQLTEIVIPDVEAQDAQQWEDLGGGDLKLRGWDSHEIIDWLYNSAGILQWVKLYKAEYIRTNPFAQELIKHTWTIIDKEKKSEYSILLENSYEINNDDLEVPKITEQSHNLGFVPCIDLKLPDGIWLGQALRGPALSNMRGRAASWWALQAQAYSVPVIKSSGDLSELSATGAIQIPEKAEFTWSNPPAEFLKSLSEWCEDTKNELYRVGSRLSYNSTDSSYALVRSAKARSADKQQDHTTMKDFGIIIKEHAKVVLDMISKIRGEGITWSVTGMEHLESLQLPDISTIAEVLSRIDFNQLNNISDTYTIQLKKRINELTFQGMKEDIKMKINKEIEEGRNIPAPLGVELPEDIPDLEK